MSSGQNASLVLRLRNGGQREITIDFDCYNFRGFPAKELCSPSLSVLRPISAESLFLAFRDADYAEATKCFLLASLKKYVEYCDNISLPVFSHESVLTYGGYIVQRNKAGELRNSTCTLILSAIKRCFILLGRPGYWFDAIPTLGKSQATPHKAYSDNDLKKLLPLLRALFKQLSAQFLKDPDYYLFASNNRPTMTFVWKGSVFTLYGTVSKMMAVATYLMSYYTWANTTSLLAIQRPEETTLSTKEKWYQMPVFKRRAFRIITLKFGDHGLLNIPKYSLEFFRELLKVSGIIAEHWANEGSPKLFITIRNSQAEPLRAEELSRFNKFLRTYFNLQDDQGGPLAPIISRFRATGSQMMQLHYSPAMSAELLGNTPRTIRRHYSEGSEFDNQSMLQDAVTIMEDKARYGENTEQAKHRRKEALGVDILAYESLLKMQTPPMKQAHGSYCQNPFGEQADRFLSRVRRHGLLSTEKFACSDLMKCFFCPHQIIVAEACDIWCLMSFKECLEESIYRHVDHRHFYQNYASVLTAIDNILKRIDNKILQAATTKLRDEGPHPLWQEPIAFLQRANPEAP
ncbi:hypothetical protein ACTMN8_002424 [Escherichia coli]|uniref:hypothetical protein n=1 Tax=Escherichia coli TaxID=562 RepID=UPI0011DD3279|nr:hypothetical protein [Escherichia coli]EAR9475551.1 hypothetical protein [Salmonella enterica]EFB7446735.1 hypothetical protein [Escherichia coli]EFB8787913.1 hypothetical protein [Escherichia coli]EJQ7660550.1 hypothetical protein [Escherichia coli]EKN5779293.1 hypothetical protein [Escherichia coli]